jgi:hypothetical protein
MNKNQSLRIAFVPLLLLTGAMQTQPVTPKQAGARAQAILTQPVDERAAQNGLPKSSDPLWLKLVKSKVSYNEKSGLFSIAVTPEIKALNGQTVSVSGFVLPMDGSDRTKHFVLTRNTPVCLFCPPGAPNEVVEVVSPRAIAWTAKMVTVTGQMSLINNGENALFFKIAAAQVK